MRNTNETEFDKIEKSDLGKELFGRYLSGFYNNFGPEEEKKEKVNGAPKTEEPIKNVSLEIRVNENVQEKHEGNIEKLFSEADNPDNDRTKLDTKPDFNISTRDKLENISSQPSIKISPYTITKYMKESGVVGEESLSNLIIVTNANGQHVMVVGQSGSGKTYIADKTVELRDEKDVYKFELTSGQAHWQNADKINAASLLYFPEFQKIVSDRGSKSTATMEFVKNMGEGKDARRTVTNKTRDGVDEYIIRAGKTMLSTIAFENAFKYDTEVGRRFVVLKTDDSPEHIKDILNSKVNQHLFLDINDNKEVIKSALSDRIGYVEGLENVHVVNPFIGYMKQAFPVVDKVQSYVNHYIKLFESWGKFYSPERASFDIGKHKIVMLNLEDNYNIFNMYHPHFVDGLKSFNEGKNVPYFFPDWDDCLRHGLSHAKENFLVKVDNTKYDISKDSPGIIKQWASSQLYDGKAFTQDYKTGENIMIADMNRFNYKITDPKRMLPMGVER